MKKASLIILAVVFSITAFGQNQTQHLTFNGVPNDGTRKPFVANMQQKSFTLLGTQGNVTLLSGDFA